MKNAKISKYWDTFDLDLIFKVKGQGWRFSCFGVSMTNGFKVIDFFN
jgi:hypothetical protein